jgi:hypothetical protein
VTAFYAKIQLFIRHIWFYCSSKFITGQQAKFIHIKNLPQPVQSKDVQYPQAT